MERKPYIDPDREEALEVRQRVARLMSSALLVLSRDVAKQIARLWKDKLGKADEGSEEYLREILEALVIEFDEDLEDDLVDELGRVYSSSGRLALSQVGAPAASELVNQINEAAIEWAEEHVGDLIGRNPNTDSWISDATRNMIRGTIVQGLEENVGSTEIARRIEETYAFSDDRAQLIALTEIATANSMGALKGYEEAKDAGVPVAKSWLILEDACSSCHANADQGIIPLEQEFQSGDLTPPAHPNCRCVIIPEVDVTKLAKLWDESKHPRDKWGRFTEKDRPDNPHVREMWGNGRVFQTMQVPIEGDPWMLHEIKGDDLDYQMGSGTLHYVGEYKTRDEAVSAARDIIEGKVTPIGKLAKGWEDQPRDMDGSDGQAGQWVSVTGEHGESGEGPGGPVAYKDPQGHGVHDKATDTYAGVTSEQWTDWAYYSADINAALNDEDIVGRVSSQGERITEEMAADFKATGEAIQAAAQSNAVYFSLYRGVSYDTEAELKAAFPHNKMLTLEGVTSTSPDISVAEMYATSDAAGPVRAIVRIDSGSHYHYGVQTSPMGVPTNEVVLPRGAQYRVAGRRKMADGLWRIDLYNKDLKPDAPVVRYQDFSQGDHGGDINKAAWDESKVRRHPAGTSQGGEFAPKGNYAEATLHNEREMVEKIGATFNPGKAALLEQGEGFGPVVPLPDGVEYGTPKMCYMNAFNALMHGDVDRNEWFYTEGVTTLPGLPIGIEHAWLTNRKGEVMDVTLRDTEGHSYFGVPYKYEYVRERVMQTEHYGIHSNGMFWYPEVAEAMGEQRAWPKGKTS